MVVAHIAFFTRTLTTTEVQTVSSQVQPWPYQIPSNQIPITSITGGFTDTDRALLTEIDDKTTTVTDTQLPAVQTDTDAILQAVTGPLQTIAGAALSTPIGSLLAHPDVNLLRMHAGSFTLSGRGTLTNADAVNFGGVYGIVWQVTTRPAGAGLTDGFVDEYEERVMQLAVMYIDHLVTNLFVGQTFDTNRDNGVFFWDRYAPHQIGYDITPGYVLTCWWFGAY
jgi:hypothetical protein